MSQLYASPLPAKFRATRFYQLFSQPSPNLHGAEIRCRAEILALTLLATSGLLMLGLIVAWVAGTVAMLGTRLFLALFVLTICYALARSQYFRIASYVSALAFLIIATVCMSGFPPLVQLTTLSPLFLLLATIIASMLLPARDTLIVAVLSLLTPFGWILLFPEFTLPILSPAIGLQTFITLFLIGGRFLKQREEQRRAEELIVLEQLLYDIPEAVIITDGDGYIQQWLGNAEGVFGYRAEEKIGDHIYSLLREKPVDENGHILPYVANSGRKISEDICLHKDGSLVPIEVTANPINAKFAPHWKRISISRDVTQQKAERRSLARSEERYRRLVELAPVAIITETDGKISFANAAMVELAGLESAAEMLGQPASKFAHPAEVEILNKRIRRSWSGTYEPRKPGRMKRIDGTIVPIEMAAIPIDIEDGNAVLGVVVDMRERLAAEKERASAVAEVHRRHGELDWLNRISQAMVKELNRENCVEAIVKHMNREWLQARFFSIFEVDADDHAAVCVYGEVDGAAFDLSLFRPQSMDSPIVALIREGVPSTVDEFPDYVQLFTTRHELLPFTPQQGMIIPLLAGTDVIGLLIALDDEKEAFQSINMTLLTTAAGQVATAIRNVLLYERAQREIGERTRVEAELNHERTMLEQRIAERTLELRETNAELRSAAKLRDEFLATVSHELRTPLTSILGLSEVLLGELHGEINEKQRKTLTRLETSGVNLLAVINDLLDVSQISAGNVELQMERIDIHMLCETSLSMVTQTAREKGIHISSSVDGSLRAMVADHSRMVRILSNLLTNAVKFTAAGGRVGLNVGLSESQEFVCFSVWDTGIGIEKTDRTRMFQPFVQLDSSLSRSYEGAGLGLTLVKQLVQLHQGTITLKSESGKGSQFTVLIPYQP